MEMREGCLIRNCPASCLDKNGCDEFRQLPHHKEKFGTGQLKDDFFPLGKHAKNVKYVGAWSFLGGVPPDKFVSKIKFTIGVDRNEDGEISPRRNQTQNLKLHAKKIFRSHSYR